MRCRSGRSRTRPSAAAGCARGAARCRRGEQRAPSPRRARSRAAGRRAAGRCRRRPRRCPRCSSKSGFTAWPGRRTARRRRTAIARSTRRGLVAASGVAQRLHLVHALAADAQHDPARHEERRRAARGCTDRRARARHPRSARSCRGRSARACRPATRAMRSSSAARPCRGRRGSRRSSGAAGPARARPRASTKNVPSGNRSSVAWATSIARRLLPMPPGPTRLTTRSAPRREQLADARQVVLAADRRRVRDGHAGDGGRRGRAVGRRRGRATASKRSASRVARSPTICSSSSLGGLEGQVGGGVVGADAVDQLVQPLVAVLGCLDVDELRHRRGGEVVLVFEAGDLLVGRDPAVAVAVDPDEDVGLGEVGAVQRAGRVGPGAELEHDRREVQAFDRGAGRAALVGELAQGRAHEHPQPLIGRADRPPGSSLMPAVTTGRGMRRRASMSTSGSARAIGFGEGQLAALALAGGDGVADRPRGSRRAAACARGTPRRRTRRCDGG